MRIRNRTRPGYFGAYGGRFAPETLMAPLEELERAFERLRRDRPFRAELGRSPENLRRAPNAL